MQKRAGKIAKLTINGQEFAVTLYDTPAANALYELLPLELTFADFNGIEKIAYMEDELPTAGELAAFNPTWAICACMRRGAIYPSSTRFPQFQRTRLARPSGCGYRGDRRHSGGFLGRVGKGGVLLFLPERTGGFFRAL